MMSSFALAFVLLFSRPASAADPHHATPTSKVTGWEALSQLQTGNMRFYEGKLQHPRQEVGTRERLASGQQPHTIVVSCSDSRVPPETVFDQGLGDLFVVRLAGNVMTPEAIASIEYAVTHLGAKLLLVMGHESCGAVGAAIASKPGVSNGSESLDVLVKQIRGNLSEASVTAGASDKSFRPGVKENVAANLRALLKQSEIVRQAAAKQGLVLGQAIYSLKTGHVEFWDVGKGLEGAAAAAHDGPALREQVVREEPIADTAPRPAKPKAKAKALAH